MADAAPTLSAVPNRPLDPETDAISHIQSILEPLNAEARGRVLAWTNSRYPARNG